MRVRAHRGGCLRSNGAAAEFLLLHQRSLLICYACALPMYYVVVCIFLGEMQVCGCRHEKLGLVGQGLILCAVGLNSVGSGCHTIYLYTMD